MKYPTLIPHLIPVEAPYITAARLAREKVCRERGLRPEEVGLFFLAPCPAKITEVKTDTGQVPLINEGNSYFFRIRSAPTGHGPY